MKLSVLMNGKTPDPSATGAVVADNMVLAVDCGATAATTISATTVKDFAVVQLGIEGVESNLNPESQDKTYLRVGKSSTKTATQRSFSISGDRMLGDDFQDFALSHAILYGTGAAVQRKYVYFNILTGKGESGDISIIVNSDSAGNAGESSTIDIELKSVGTQPEEFTYSAS